MFEGRINLSRSGPNSQISISQNKSHHISVGLDFQYFCNLPSHEEIPGPNSSQLKNCPKKSMPPDIQHKTVWS